jgi:hypothetical protein
MVHSDLGEVTGEMRPAAQQYLQPDNVRRILGMATNERGTYVEDLLIDEFTPAKRPIKGLDGSVPGEEVVSPNVGISWKCIEASAHHDERRRVVYFVENDLKDFVCSEREDER